MARNYGQIQSAIWQDTDFKTQLGADAQWLYFTLLSQPNLNTAGVLPLQDRRWKKLAKDMTADRVDAALGALRAYWYVVVDEETEEALVRTFIRNDGLWKQPNVLQSALRHAKNTMSPLLRAVIRDELSRLPLEELSEERKEKTRTLIERVSGTLPGTLPEGFREPPQNPPGNPSDAEADLTNGQHMGQAMPPFRDPELNPQVMEVVQESGQAQIEGFPEGFAEGLSEPSGVGAGVGVGAGESLGEEEIPKTSSSGPTTKKPKSPKKKTPDPDTQRAQELAQAFWERYKTGSTQTFIAVRQCIKTSLKNGVNRDDLARALDALGQEGTPVSGGTLGFALKRVSGRHLQAVSGGYEPYRNPTDHDVYDEGLLS